MAALVQQLLAVVLAMDIQKLSAQGLELGHRHRAAVDPAQVLAVGQDLPLEEKLPVLVGAGPVLGKPGQGLHLGEGPRHQGRLGPRADQVPAGPLPGDRPHSVHHDGLARAGLTGEGVEAPTEDDVRRLDDGDILDVKDGEHHITPYAQMAGPCPGLSPASPASPRRTPPPPPRCA